VAQETKRACDVLLGFSAGTSPAKSLQAKVGEKPKDGGYDGGHNDSGLDDGGIIIKEDAGLQVPVPD